jgi:hypothetical protein
VQIQINTDHNIEGTEPLVVRVEAIVAKTLRRFSDQITRVEVHLSDQNGSKTSQDEKRCMMEVRLQGQQPASVTHDAASVDQAVEGASNKLKRLLESTLGRKHRRQN